ncbi:MAG: hypothetical protein QOH42_386 [Blastocatellia bacterium]|jgi:hypothetical protein|nr:hypothetical protein [Blastocatellia bacterium]
MNNGNGFEKKAADLVAGQKSAQFLHPAWLAFVRYCQELRHGEIERLKIQDGLPVLAEVTREKIKFNS